MVNLIIEYHDKIEYGYAAELLERVFNAEKIDNRVDSYSLKTTRPLVQDIPCGVISPTPVYRVRNDWTVKLKEDKIYIISDHICSVIDLTKERLFAIYPIFRD